MSIKKYFSQEERQTATRDINRRYKQTEKGKEAHRREARLRAIKDPKSYWCKNTISNHLNKGYLINFTFDELKLLADKTDLCLYCGIYLNWEYGKGLKFNGPSLDRINNELNLTKDNIQIICYSCNTRKGIFTPDQLKDWCKKVLLVLENKG
jgi:hypothetical protein